MTKVLLPHRLLGNIYVQELGRAYRALGCEVLYGPDNFFESNYRPDILHLNWPEELYRSVGSGSDVEGGQRLVSRIDELTRDNTFIAWTVHNAKPHETENPTIDSGIYQAVIDRVHLAHHHCRCSVTELSKRYTVPSDMASFIAPHGHYFSYENNVSRKEARARLGLSQSSYVYLHFGAVRAYKGIDRVFQAFRKVKKSNDHLVVAGRLSGGGGLAERAQLAIYRYCIPSVTLNLNSVNSGDIQLYVNAANALVLGHSAGLNSGVAVLGMTFGRPVIGPRLGCIVDVLEQGMNSIYEARDLEDLCTQLRAVRDLPEDEVYERNTAAARSWSWQDIARPVLDHYKEFTSKAY